MTRTIIATDLNTGGDRRQEAPYPGRHAWPCDARHRPSCRYPGPRRRNCAQQDPVWTLSFFEKAVRRRRLSGSHLRARKALPNLKTEIVKRSDNAKGFEVLPKRWVVERTFAWLGKCRRLGKDYENRTRNALAFLKLASIRSILRNYVMAEKLSGRTLRPKG
jgi:transposase